MTEEKTLALLAQLPPIRRARGFRLYSRDGRRFLDFCQEGGAGILGSRVGPAVRMIKDDLEAGRSQRLPSDGMKALGKAALRLFPGYRAFRCYASAAEAERALAASGIPASETAAWSPFLPVPEARALTVRPPLPESLRPALVLLSEPGDERLLVPGLPAAFQPRAAARALYDARKEETTGLPARERLWRVFDDIAGPGLFEHRGPYLRPLAPERYEETFARFLSGGVLLSPDPAVPSIVPGSFEPGELSFLKEASR